MTTFLIPQGFTFDDQTVGFGQSVIDGEAMTITLGDLAGTMRIVQESRFGFSVYWDLEVPQSVLLFRGDTQLVFLGTFPFDHPFAGDINNGVAIGQEVTYMVTGSSSLLLDTIVVLEADEGPETFGPIDPLVDRIRYTSLELVKARLGITHTEADVQLTSAIISAEVAIDYWNGRSFPDTGTNPEIAGVPEGIRTWATDASIAVWKAADAPFGQGGGDAWLGALDIQQITERVIRRHPLSLGYKVSWGVG
jgi:hypothetical protein